MQSHVADSCQPQIPLGSTTSPPLHGPAQKLCQCQCQCSPWNAAVPDRISIFVYVVYVYTVPVARRKAHVCQHYDTTRPIISIIKEGGTKHWSCRSHSAISTRAISISRPCRRLSALTSCIHHRTACRSANAMPAPQLYLCSSATQNADLGLDGVLVAFSELFSAASRECKR